MSTKVLNAGTLEGVTRVFSVATVNSGLLNASSEYLLTGTAAAYIKIAKDPAVAVTENDTYLPANTPLRIRTTENKNVLQAIQVTASGCVFCTEIS